MASQLGGLRSANAFTVTYRVKEFFFDRLAVINAMDKKTRTVLRHAGGLTRKIARNSMRRRKASSPAGQPPSAHSKDKVATLKNILYAYDGRWSVIVGPVGLNQKNEVPGVGLQPGVVPATQEFGGTIGHLEKFVPFTVGGAIRAFGPVRGREYVREFGTLNESAARKIYKESFPHRHDRRLGGIWVPISRKRRNRFKMRVRRATYPPRPYMRPALAKAAAKFPELYARSFEG